MEEIRGKKSGEKKSGLYSTVQYCTVLYSTVQYFFIGYDKKKITNAPRSAGWAKRVFDFFHAFLDVV